jgi:hypothetical protein
MILKPAETDALPARRRSTASAARVQRYRRRRRLGEIVLRVAVDEHALVSYLISTKRVSEAEALDRRLIERAVADVMADLTGRWRAKKV